MSARLRLIVLAAAAVAGVLLILLALKTPREAAGGWLVAFLFWSSVSVGSLLLLMIHKLTGGEWGLRWRSAFEPAAAAVPLMALLLIPVFVALPAIYPWMHDASGLIPSVAKIYLNAPSYIARSVIAFCGWTVLAIIVLRRSGPTSTLLSALGLVFYGIFISMVPVDWVLSVEHPFISKSFGASIAITQLISALAWAAVLGPIADRDPVESDLAGLLLAMVLAIVYVDFMAYLVIWYGDLPHKVFVFVERDRFPWSAFALGFFVLGAVVPVLSLLLARVRNSRRALRVIGLIELAGIALYYTWLVAPAFGALSLLAAGLALIAIGCLFTAFVSGGGLMIAAARRGAAHAQ